MAHVTVRKNKEVISQPTAEPTGSSSVSWLEYSICAIILAAAAIISYLPSLHYSFQFDDIANIQKFFSIRHIRFWDICFSNPRWISYWLNALNYCLGKFDPFTYRLCNLLFHTTTGLLTFCFWILALSRVSKNSFFYKQRLTIAFTAALLFLLHPVQTQTVSYVIQGQLEGTAGLFCMAIAVCFLVIANAQSTIKKLLLTVLLFILAAFATGTKEIAIVCPLLIFITDWFFVAQGNFVSLKKRWFLHAGLFIIIWGTYIYFLKPTFFFNIFGLKIQARNNIGNILTEQQGQPILPLHFFISQFKVLLHYIFMFIWPFTISVEYDWKLSAHFFAPDAILPFLMLVTLAILIILRLRKDRTDIFSFAWLWFFVANAPRTTIIPSSELMADYKTYLASVALLFLFGTGIVFCINKITQWCITKIPIQHWHAQYACLLILIFPFGLMTIHRNTVWRSAVDFWTNITENAPGKARAYNNLGVAYSELGMMAQSIPLYKRAINMDDKYPDPWNNLAVAYSMTGKLDLAIDTLKKAIKIHQTYPEGYNNLASFLIQKKEYALAEKMLQIAIKLRPHYGKAYFNMGKNYFEQGKMEEAFEAFKAAATKADLDNENGFAVYGNLSMNLHKYEDAIIAYSKLLEFQPNSSEYALNLANAYFLTNKFQEAIAWFNRITKVAPHEARAWYNMAECYLKTGNPHQALNCFKQVEQLKYPIATLPLRVAYCYRLIGQDEQAKKILQTCLNNADAPENVKKLAAQELAIM
jgi:tetratricopeptide (TPR) repeat protein